MAENKMIHEAPEKIESAPRADLLQKYMKSILRFTVLDKEKEKDLTKEYAKTLGLPLLSRDIKVRTQLVDHNLRLVVKIAFEYRAAINNLMDLIQEGNIGLMLGVDKFDPDAHKGVPLANYAALWIRAYMLRYIMNSSRLVKVGTTESQRKLFFNLAKEKARLEGLGIEATDSVIAEHLEVDEKEVSEMKQRMAGPESSISVDEDDKQEIQLESEVDRPDIAFEREEYNASLRTLLSEFRQSLVTKGASKKIVVFDLRYMKEEEDTFQVIADREDMNVSKARVQQIDAKIKSDLKFFLRNVI